jgi:hypothetical protein
VLVGVLEGLVKRLDCFPQRAGGLPRLDGAACRNDFDAPALLENVAPVLQEGLLQDLAASSMYAETLAHVVLNDASAGAELRQLIETLHAHAKDALARAYALAAGRLPE